MSLQNDTFDKYSSVTQIVAFTRQFYHSPLLAVPNVTAYPSAASVPITVLLYDGQLLCGCNVAIKGLISLRNLVLTHPECCEFSVVCCVIYDDYVVVSCIRHFFVCSACSLFLICCGFLLTRFMYDRC